jgi:catechol 2,3-dioxygenase-like lactoylglutathione lyase family enzyme
MDMKLEVITVPVSDVDRAKAFYKQLGFREDIDLMGDDFRVVQYTPPGSAASIFIGTNITTAAPGSAQGLVLVVDDIGAAHQNLIDKGIETTDIFHDPGGLFYHVTKTIQNPGPEPENKSYNSFIAFVDPDGNGWIVQEITERLPGRI